MQFYLKRVWKDLVYLNMAWHQVKNVKHGMSIFSKYTSAVFDNKPEKVWGYCCQDCFSTKGNSHGGICQKKNS